VANLALESTTVTTASAYRSAAVIDNAPDGSSTTNAVVPGKRWFCQVAALPG